MRTLLSLLLFVSISIAAPPTLKLPEKIDVKRCEPTKIVAETTGIAVIWLSDDVKFIDPADLKDQKTTYATVTKAGTFKVTVVAISDKGEWVKGVTNIVVADDLGPTPTPVDPEKNKPKPKPPEPIAGKLKSPFFIIVIEETFNAAKTRGEFFDNSELFGKIVKEKKHSPWVLDKDVQVFDEATGKPTDVHQFASYLKDAPKKGLPYFYLVDKTGKKVEGKMPATVEEFIKIIIDNGG